MNTAVALSALAGMGMLVAAAETACSSKPTTVAAWKSVCELPRHRDLTAGQGRERVTASLAAARDAAGNPEVRTAIEQSATLDPPAAATSLREQASRAGVASCALADHVERTALADSCRRGDAAACMAGARLYATASIYPEEEKNARPRLLELACLHGDAAGCLERAALGDEATWKDAACRRGNRTACPKKQPADPPLRARLGDAPAGPDPVVDKVQKVYARSLEDCAAAARPRPTGTVEVGFAVADGLVAEPKVVTSAGPAIESCARERVAGWAFAGARAGKKYQLRFRLEEASSGADIGDAIDAARRRAAGMDLGVPKPPPGPRVTLLDIAAEHDGPVQTGEIWHRYTLSLHNQFEACWKAALKRDKSAAGGMVVVGAKVNAGGAIDDAKVQESFEKELGACIAGKIDTWRVPVLNTDAGAKLRIVAWFEVIK